MVQRAAIKKQGISHCRPSQRLLKAHATAHTEPPTHDLKRALHTATCQVSLGQSLPGWTAV